MQSLLASVRNAGGLDRVDHAVQLLEEEWRRRGDVALGRLWAEQKPRLDAEPGESVVLLAELVKTDLRCRFARGQTPAVADYLEQFPELGGADSRVLSLIYEEFCLAEERGDRVDVEAFCARYPRWKDSLVSQLQYHHLFSQAAGAQARSPSFPDEGAIFEEFQLVALMGRGGTSRVFLARDLSLGGKQVVLKVSLDRGREPQAQGALDHPHIVPVNSVVFADDGMRGLSMPYRPGLPLDEMIRRVDPASRPRSAMALWEALVGPGLRDGEPRLPDLPAEVRAAGPRGDGWEGFPVKGTYPWGVAWVVKVVAEALHYAHEHATFHRDVKPANVLLTVHHGPQLLDFNLAESPHSASQAQAAMHGGTLPYMAPEQIEAFLNPDLWGKVGAAADIYSLGLVLRELLTGQAPDLPPETLAPPRAMRVLLDRRPLLDVSVRRSNPDIPHALEAIVARCLAVAVEDRYPDAGTLAEDLGRFLRREPLAHAVNPSGRERGANWARRNRGRLAAAATGLLLCLAFLFGGMVLERSRDPGRPRSPIEDTRELGTAVSALNGGHVKEGEALFNQLARWYPNSGIPRIYLSLIYQLRDHEMDAERAFSEAMAIPDVERQMIAWGRKDPQLPGRLDVFVNQRFYHAEQIEKGGGVEGERKRIKEEQYRLAKCAKDICLGIRENDPRRPPVAVEDVPADGESKLPAEARSDPDLSDYDLARIAQEDGEYESVIGRADHAIKEIGTRPRAEQVRLRRQLYQWRRLRSRALTKLAERRRSEGSKEALEGALRYIELADKDLAACNAFTDNELSDTRARDQFFEDGIRVVTSMNRVDIELDLGFLKQARFHFNKARDVMRKYDERAHNVGETRYIDAHYDRLKRIDNRLRQEEAKRAAKNTPAGPPRDA